MSEANLYIRQYECVDWIVQHNFGIGPNSSGTMLELFCKQGGIASFHSLPPRTIEELQSEDYRALPASCTEYVILVVIVVLG